MASLINPNMKFYELYINVVHNSSKDDKNHYMYYENENAKDFLERVKNNRVGNNLQNNCVATTTLWLVNGNDFIGSCNIRHNLNEKLLKYGGNIGYIINETFRNKGYGTLILKLAL